ncbi:ribonuclease H-like domain-containing protein [Tanacetum coccineum]|uniref:Ribonuclease H-like domain-containing protein n=1 Tax=Tanacetum coccineum TaxID=301880 RepID=A0ABQ5J5I5_9ASTR
MRRFHGMDDAKEIWKPIRTRVGGNANSKKMQKAVFKQQFEAFKISNSEGLEKGYDRFQQLLSQLEAHGAEVSTEDANHKFLRSLPSAWSNLAMTMRTNPEIDNLSIDDFFLHSFTSSAMFLKKCFLLVLLDEILKEHGLQLANCNDCYSIEEFFKKKEGEFAQRGHMMERRREILFSNQEAGKQVENQMGCWTMDDGISSNEVSLCSKTCIDSYNKLKTLCDEQMNQLGDQEAQILAYSQAVKKLEAQLVTSQKQQLSLNEKLAFQANEIHEKDEKLKRYRRIGMKAVKEKEQLQKTVDSWKDSSKNLWRLINSGMSSNDKLGLGFEIQSNDEVLSYEEEMNFSVFKCSKEDSIGKPSYSRFTKTNDFKGVPPPLSGDYTPNPQEEIDDSLYVYGKKGPQKPEISVSDDNSSEHSTCQSNDSEGSYENTSEHSFETESVSVNLILEHPLKNMVDRGIFDSGCSGHMTELGHFNLFSISQICDKQHKVLFTETECLVVSSDFKMPDENQILLKVPRHHNMYSFDMKTPSPAKGFACLIAKATADESKLWHRRLGHINFKNLNKLVKGNLVRGLPSKVFKYDHTCVACQKGKQHRASCKAKLERLITKPLHTLHMDLFGPTSVKSINHASYCLVITDDCTRKTQLSKGISEVTKQCKVLSQTPESIANEKGGKSMRKLELIVVPSAVKIQKKKSESRTTFHKNSKTEGGKTMTEPQMEMRIPLLILRIQLLEDSNLSQGLRQEFLMRHLMMRKCVTELQQSSTEIEVVLLLHLDLPHGMKVIGTKWVYRNKRDERGVVVRNKARLVAQGVAHRNEYWTMDEVFALVAE